MPFKHAGIRFTATLADAARLFNAGGRALARIEHNGVKTDTKYLDKTRREVKTLIERKEKGLYNYKDVMTPWKKRYGRKTNLQSTEQIGEVFFKDLEFKYPVKRRNEDGKLENDLTASGKWRTDEKTLSKIKHPFMQDYFEIKHLKTDLGTFLNGIKEELTPAGFIHPVYNLHLVNTYRSSSDSPNFQNFPARDPVRMDRIRRSCISRFKRGHIVDIDFKAVEVSVAACYHCDPTMVKYLEDGHDLHEDMAAQIFGCRAEQVSKKARYCSKNGFVFPEFYGQYYIDVSKNLWDMIDTHKLEVDGVPMRGWLLKKLGIRKLGICDPNSSPRPGTFEKHIADIEKHFWYKRFPVYTEWKKRWHNAYLSTGRIPFFTGFVVEGSHSRNEVINYPIQGAAFHCALWSIVEMMKALRKYKMKSLIIGQIHDSVVGDIPDNELQDYLDIAHEITSKKLRKHFDWITVPVGTEVEVTPAGKSWADKAAWEKRGSKWQLAA